MEPILCGIETEYGLHVEGKGAEEQVDLAKALIRSYPNQCLLGWDYTYESPRADLRGFHVDKLQIDPEDAKFDAPRNSEPDFDARSDRILANGARLYNDHGHPEFATPESASSFQAALLDQAGELAVLQAASAFAQHTGAKATLYKNNIDFHGASYGCHENYLVPRSVGWQTIQDALIPMLVVRQVLAGAGKVGSDSGAPCKYQLSQRADFFECVASADTLYRRPIFNTRDEPHAAPQDWMRIHVICGDANMMPIVTARKLALAKLAIQLAIAGKAPKWDLSDPVGTIKSLSRDSTREFRIPLGNGSWTNAYEVFESYFSTAEALGWIDSMEYVGENAAHDPYLIPFAELRVIPECRDLLRLIRNFDPEAKNHVDWAAKLALMEMAAEPEAGEWNLANLRSFDLAYANISREDGLFYAMVDSGDLETPVLPLANALPLLYDPASSCRSEIRSFLVRNYAEFIESLSWGVVNFRIHDRVESVDLPPNWFGSMKGIRFSSVESCIEWLRGENVQQN